tara:strand:+ start:15006 stop:15416 length:411 start_codon:yes stop_codon:yes gene_type:complete
MTTKYEVIVMSLPQMLKASIDDGTMHVHGKITKQIVTLDEVTATKVTYEPGAKWSIDLKDHAGSKSCLLPHVAYVISGAIEVQMDDGTKETFREGDIMMLPPGHDAWTVGNEPCEFIQMSQGDSYYSDRVNNYSIA